MTLLVFWSDEEKKDLIWWVDIICNGCQRHQRVSVLKALVWNWVNKTEKDFQTKNTSEDVSNNNSSRAGLL